MKAKRILSAALAAVLSCSLLSAPALALEPEDLRELLSSYYVDSIPSSVLEQDSVEGILAALGDPYTVYMTAEEYQDFLAAVNGEQVVGIGVSIENGAVEQGLLILSVLDGSPAQAAGLVPGDRILTVDGVEITSVDQTALISGEEGTQVTISVLRAESGAVEEFTLQRQAVQIPIVTHELVDGVPVITCQSFGDSTSSTIHDLILEYQELPQPWLLDLRSNPGGTSQSAAATAGWFVGNAMMVYFRNGSGDYSYLYTAPFCPDLTDKPLIVLTSSYSASASELFSAAIRDHGAGIAIGERTYGKGVAQVVFDQDNRPDLFAGDCLKVTLYRFFSPDGATNDTVGVLPTLLLDPEYTQAAAMLLSAPQPERPEGFLRLTVAGQELYIDLEKAMEEDNQAAFAHLLEAIPPAEFALLEQGSGRKTWTAITPQALAESLELPFQSRSFSDLEGSTYRDEIDLLALYDIVGGFEDGTFRPQSTLTRGELCAMLASALNLSQGGSLPYSDVAADSWYAQSISAMTKKGFLAGYEDGTFRPDNTITYQELLTILSSVARWICMEGYELSQDTYNPDYYPGYDSWAVPGAGMLDQLISPLVSIYCTPQEEVTREMAAKLLFEVMDSAGLFWLGEGNHELTSD